MIPYRSSAIKLQQLLRACIYAGLLCAFFGAVADARAQSKGVVCAALDMSTEDCALITDDGVSTTLPSGVILPRGGSCCQPVAMDVPWYVSPVKTAGANSLRSGDVSDTQASCLVLAISLPADTLARFSLRTSSQGQHDRLAFFVDDQTVISNFSAPGGSEIRDWEQLEFVLASNVSNLSWCYIKNASASTEDDSGWLDNLTLTPTADIPLNRELVCRVLDIGADDCALISTISFDPPNLPWSVSPFSTQGTGSLRSSTDTDHDQTSCLVLAVSLPANSQIGFSLRTSSEAVNDYLYFAADGNRLTDRYTASPGSVLRDWEQQEFDIRSSISRLKWCYTKNDTVSAGDDSGWLDTLSLTVLEAIPLTPERICRALDMNAADCALITDVSTTPPSGVVLPPTRGGTRSAVTDVPWFASPIARRGGTSLRSGNIGNRQASCLVLAVTLPANTRIRFSLRTDSQGLFDRLAFFADTVRLIENFSAPRLSTVRDWEQQTFSRSNSISNLTWCYLKNQSSGSGPDSGWLDLLSFSDSADFAGTLLTQERVCRVLDMSPDDCALIRSVDSDPRFPPWFVSEVTAVTGPAALRSGDIADNQRSCLILNVSIPANNLIRFSLRADSEGRFDHLYFEADNRRLIDTFSAAEGSRFRNWEQLEFVSAESIDTLTWCYVKNPAVSLGGDNMRLDDLTIEDYKANICATLDMSPANCARITSVAADPPDRPWEITSLALQGGGSLRSADIDDDQQSCLVLGLSLPANSRIRFALRTSSEAVNDFLYFETDETRLIDNFSAAEGSSLRNWEQLELLILSGTSNLGWCYTKNDSTSAGDDSGWLDDLSFSNFASLADIPLSRAGVCQVLDMSAAECARITSVSSEPAESPWFISLVATEGGFSLRSGDINDDQESCLILNVSLPGQTLVEFSRRISSQPGVDMLYFAADDQRLNFNLIPAANTILRDWRLEPYILPADTTTLSWCYSKDADTSEGDDSAWLDDLSLTAPPAAQLSRELVCLVLDMNADDCARIIGVASAPATPPWYISFIANQGGTALRSDPATNDDQTSCLVLDVSLPANSLIRFALRTNSEAVNDFLYFAADGIRLIEAFTAAAGSSIRNWEQLELYVLSDISTLVWCYTKNDRISRGDDSGWFDTLSFSDFASLADIPLSRGIICQVLDMTAAECALITGISSEPTESPWFVSSIATEGGSSLRSGDINDDQESCLILNMTLPGQTVVQFSRRISSQPGVDRLYFAADDQRLNFNLIPAANTVLRDWRLEPYILPTGDTTLSWCYGKDGDTSEGEDSAWLDDLSLTAPSNAQLSRELVCLVLDMSADDCTRITGVAAAPAAPPWFISTVANQGGLALRSGDIGDDQSSCLVLEVSLPANSLIRFALRTNSEAMNDFLYFEADETRLIDNFSAAEGTNLRAYEPQELFVLSDISTLIWCYTKNSDTSAGDDSGWLDVLSLGNFANLADISLSRGIICQVLDMTAAECALLTGISSEPAESPWFVSAVATEGGSSLRSDDINDDQQSCLILNMSLPGQTVVQFSRRISSQPGADMLYFSADDQRLDFNLIPAANTVLRDWRPEPYILPAGDTTLSWCYSKDGDTSEGDDSAWLDDLSLTAPSAAPLTRGLVCLVLDMSADDCARITRVAAAPADLPWAVSDTANQGGTALRSNPATDNDQTSCLVLEVSLPASSRLRFSLRSSSEGDLDFLYFEADGVRLIENFSASTDSIFRDWEPQELLILGGTRNLSWCYNKTHGLSRGDDSGWLDTLSFNDLANPADIPLTRGVICQALDMTTADCRLITDVTLEPTGTPWLVSAVATEGSSSLRSGDIADDQESCLILSVSLPEQTLIEFSVRTDSEAVNDFLYFEADGIRLIDSFTAGPGSALRDWEPQEFFIASSVGTMSWCYTKNDSTRAGDDSGWLDALTFTPPAERPLTQTLVCQALDMSTDDCALITDISTTPPSGAIIVPLTTDLDGNAPQIDPRSRWFTSSIAFEGNSSLRSGGNLLRTGVSCLVLAVTLPANSRISFSLRLSGFPHADLLTFFADDQRLIENFTTTINPAALLRDWEQQEFFLSNSINSLSWCFYKGSSPGSGDAAWLDALSFTAPEDIPLTRERTCQILDMSSSDCARITSIISEPPESPWFISSTATEGSSSLGSAEIADDQQSCLILDVSLPEQTLIEFSLRTDSEAVNDFLYFEADGVRLIDRFAAQSGSALRDWEPQELFIASSVSTLRWCYSKNGSTSAGNDRGWLDALTFTTLASPPLTREPVCQALDMSADDCALITDISTTPPPGAIIVPIVASDNPPQVDPVSWWSTSSIAFEGDRSLRSGGNLLRTRVSCLVLAVTLPANSRIRFSLRFFGFFQHNFLDFFVDDQLLIEHYTSLNFDDDLRDWEQQEFFLSNSINSLSWCFYKGSSGNAANGWLDALSFTTPDELPLTRELVCQALDMSDDECAQLTSVATEPVKSPWFISETATEGSSSLGSGDIDDGLQSCLLFGVSLSARTVVAFSRRVSSQPMADMLYFAADDRRLEYSPRPVANTVLRDWSREPYVLPAGNSSISWCYSKDGDTSEGEDRAWIDDLSFTSLAATPLTRELLCQVLDMNADDCAKITSVSSAPAQQPWSVSTTATAGGSSFRSGDIGDNQQSCLVLALALPANTMITVAVRTSSAGPADQLRVFADLQLIDTLSADAGSSERDWALQTYYLPDDIPALSWCYVKDSTNTAGADSVWIDSLSFSTSDIPYQNRICDTLDLTDTSCAMIRSIATDRDYLWGITEETAAVGDTSLRSRGTFNNIFGGDRNCFGISLRQPLPGPTRIHYSRRISAELNSDRLVLGINGTLSEIDGFTAESTVLREWEQGQFVIPDNVASLDWCYIKDGTDAVGADSIWIDALSFVTAEVQPLCDTLDLPQSLCAMILAVNYDPPQQLWLTTTTAFIGGDSSLVSPPLAAGQTACLTLDIDNTLPSGSYLAFAWRTTGPSDLDILEFQAGSQQREISNMPQWQIETVLLDGSESTLRWCYRFNSAADGQTARGWLDSLLPIPAADRYATQLAVTRLPALLSSTSNSFRFQVTATAVSPTLSPPEDWVLIVSGIDNIASADASHALVFSDSLAQVEVVATSANPLLPASIRLALDDQSLLPGVTVTSLTYMLPPLRQLDMLNIMAPDSVTQTDPGVAIDIAVDVAAIDNFGNLFNPTGLVLTVDTAEGARVSQSTFALTFSEGSARTNISAELTRTGSAGSIEVSVSSGETRGNASITLNPAPVRLALLAIVVPDAVVQSELDAMFEIAVTVTATDNYGNPFEPAGLVLTVTDSGNARVPQSTYALSFAAGTAQTTITVGLTTGGIAGNIELSVGSGDTLSTASITLGPVPPILASITLSAADSSLVQTMAATAVAAELILAALDQYGNPIEAGEVSLQLSASEGATVQPSLIVTIEAGGSARQLVEIDLPNDRDTTVTVQILRGTLDESVQLLPEGGIQIAVRALRVLRQLQLSLADRTLPLQQVDRSIPVRARVQLIGLDQYGQLIALPTVLLTATPEPMTTVVALDPQQLSTTVPEEAETVLEVMFPELLDTTITIAIANPGTGVTVNELVVRALPDRRPPLQPLHVDDTDTGVTELDLIVALRWLADQQSSTQSRVVNLKITDTDVTAAGIDNLRQLFTDPANLDRIDLNGDGRADQLDLRILLRYISGLRGTELAEQGISETAIRLIRRLLDQP